MGLLAPIGADFHIEGISPRPSRIKTSLTEGKDEELLVKECKTAQKNKQNTNKEKRRNGKLLTSTDWKGEFPVLARVIHGRARCIKHDVIFHKELFVRKANKETSNSKTNSFLFGKKSELKTPTEQDIKLLEEFSRKLPDKAVLDILRSHFTKLGDHTRDEYFRRAIKWRRGTAEERQGKEQCVICGLQRIASRPIQTDYEKIKSSTQYPHEFYNTFSREIKQMETRDRSDIIQICKKADLKEKCSEVPTIPPAPPGSVLEYIPITPLPVEKEDADYSNSRAERLMQMYLLPRRFVHRSCKPKPPTFMPGADVLPPDLAAIYKQKALKGCFTRKLETELDNADGTTSPHYMAYPVDALGLSFNIPVHNSNFRPNAPSPSAETIYQESRIIPKQRSSLLPSIKRTKHLIYT